MVKALPADSGRGGPLARLPTYPNGNGNGNGKGKKKQKALGAGRGGPVTPMEVTETPIGEGLGPGQPQGPFADDATRDQTINNQWNREASGGQQLAVIVSGGNGNGIGNGPPPGGEGTTGSGSSKESKRKKGSKGGGVNWGKVGHYAKEAAIYGSGAGYGRMRYREWKEEGALAEPKAQEMASRLLGIQEDLRETSYYTILGVKPTATQEEIHKAFRARVKLVHPDPAVNRTPEAEEAMRLLNEANEVLSDPAKRAAYDRAQAEKQAAKGTGKEWKDLPGSYRRKFRGQARKQVRTEAEVYSEAQRLGIPIEQPILKKWEQLNESEQQQVRNFMGFQGEPNKDQKKTGFAVGSSKKSVANLTLEIEAFKGTVGKLKAEKGLQEGRAREFDPDKRKKATQLAAKTGKFIGSMQAKAGTTPLASRLKQRGVQAGVGQHQVTQAASSTIRSMGLGGGQLRGTLGSSPRLRATQSQGRLTRAGGAATVQRVPFTRERLQPAGRVPIKGSRRKQLRSKF